MTHEETTRHTTHSEDFLPGDNRRKQALSARLKAIRERLGLRQVDMEKLHSTLTEGRVRQWESVTHMGARPRASGFVVLSRLFGYPYEYFWPPMPEDGVSSIDLDALLTSVREIGEKIRAGEATEEEIEQLQHLLAAGSRIIRPNALAPARPILHLVCWLDELPEVPDGLPGPLDPWDGAWVMPVPGARADDRIFAYRLPVDSGMKAGTVVIFRRLPDSVDTGRWVVGVRDGTPSVYRWPWNRGTPLGEVMLVVREP